jgi:hypothetical protein
MSPSTSPTDPGEFGDDLRRQVHRAARLSHALAGLIARVEPADPSFLWLLGRADEVRAVVGTAMRDWQENRISAARAAESMGTYVQTLEESLRAFFGSSRPVPGPGGPGRPRDTLVDA